MTARRSAEETGATGGSRPSSSPASIRRRAAIVEATRTRLRTHDLDKVTVADVAADAGVSVATVYNLVGNREQVLVSVVDAYLDELDRTLIDRGAIDALAVVEVAIELTLIDPAPLRAIVRELGPLQFVEHRRQSLDDLLAARLADHPDPETTARFVAYGFRGLLLSWANGMIDDERLRLDATTLTLRLLADPSGSA